MRYGQCLTEFLPLGIAINSVSVFNPFGQRGTGRNTAPRPFSLPIKTHILKTAVFLFVNHNFYVSRCVWPNCKCFAKFLTRFMTPLPQVLWAWTTEKKSQLQTCLSDWCKNLCQICIPWVVAVLLSSTWSRCVMDANFRTVMWDKEGCILTRSLWSPLNNFSTIRSIAPPVPVHISYISLYLHNLKAMSGCPQQDGQASTSAQYAHPELEPKQPKPCLPAMLTGSKFREGEARTGFKRLVILCDGKSHLPLNLIISPVISRSDWWYPLDAWYNVGFQ